MSLEELQGAIGKPKDESYSPGRHIYNPHIIAEIIPSYTRMGKNEWNSHGYQILEERYMPQLRLIEDFNGQDFLDDAVALYGACEPHRYSDFKASEIHLLLNPVLRMLYTMGQNNLTLDLSDARWAEGDIPQNIAGTEQDPFMLTYFLPPKDLLHPANRYRGVCDALTQAVVRVTGDAYYFGWDSKDSVFYINGKVTQMGGSSNCAYHLVEVTKARMELLGKNDNRLELFYIRNGITREMILGQDFFEEGNSILIPDGEDGWKEVKL